VRVSWIASIAGPTAEGSTWVLGVVVVDRGAPAGGLAGGGVDVLRALEHQVLDDVREAAALRRVVDGADVIAQVDGHQRQPGVASPLRWD